MSNRMEFLRSGPVALFFTILLERFYSTTKGWVSRQKTRCMGCAKMQRVSMFDWASKEKTKIGENSLREKSGKYREAKELETRLDVSKIDPLCHKIDTSGRVRRCWIEKPGGGRRPLGLPTVEDKIVQGAVVELLSGVYEADFYGFSYGFRPGRGPHTALRALQTVLQKGKVNWVLDADISQFFDTIDHKELMSVIRRRVIDRRLLRLMGKWLSVGVVEEDGRRVRPKAGDTAGWGDIAASCQHLPSPCGGRVCARVAKGCQGRDLHCPLCR